MVKKTTRRAASSKGGPSGAKKFDQMAKAAGKKERLGQQEFDDGTYTFQLEKVSYGTKNNPDKETFFTTCRFRTGVNGVKGKSITIGWNVDGKMVNDTLSNFDLFYFFLDDLDCVPTSFDPKKLQEKVNRVKPIFTAQLSKTKTDRGGLFYNLRYAKKLSKEEIAAID